MRIVFAAATLAVATLAFDMQPAAAADLALKTRVHRHRVHVAARAWCVIDNLGTAVWTCAPTRAQCHAFEIPGTTFFCVRDPIPGRPFALR